jgi:hypothetical protein
MTHAEMWQEAVRDGDSEKLIENIRTFDVFPFRHLDSESFDLLHNLAFNDPQLRAALQSGAETFERAIGVSIPLRFSVFAESPAAALPSQGIAFYLGARGQQSPVSPSLQLFTLPSSADEAETQRITTPPKLVSRAHAPKLWNHFAKETVETVAAHHLTGFRVTPLSAPLKSDLSEGLTRIGRFTFVGLNRGGQGETREAILSALERLQGHVDVLMLGGLAAAESGFVDAALVTLKPRVALVPVDGAAAVHTFGYTTVQTVSPNEPVLFELDPLTQRIDVRSGRSERTVPLKRQDRVLDILEKNRTPVTHDLVRRLQGAMTASTPGARAQGAWRWAKITMNGVIPMALRYALMLDFDPVRYASAPEREEALMRVIDEMTDPLGFRDTVPDHVWALKEILLRSGLLGPSR